MNETQYAPEISPVPFQLIPEVHPIILILKPLYPWLKVAVIKHKPYINRNEHNNLGHTKLYREEGKAEIVSGFFEEVTYDKVVTAIV